MKITHLFLFFAFSLSSLHSYEVYRTNFYPGAVNHRNSVLSFGMFSLNTMESDSGKTTITETLADGTVTIYNYTYDGEGRLTGFNETTQSGGKELTASGNYEYAYTGDVLNSVLHDGKVIYHLTPQSIYINKGGEDLRIDLEKDEEGNLKAMTLNDQNGTRFLFSDGKVLSEESIGTSDYRFSAQYSYSEDSSLKHYRSEASEGRGETRKTTEYSFSYDKGLISDYFYDKRESGHQLIHIHCTFEHVTGDKGRVEESYAQDDDGNIVRIARYEYKSPRSYTIRILDERNRLVETIEVEKQ